MIEVTTYCDESQRDGMVLVVAGYWAPAVEWKKLEIPWTGALREEDLSEFHAEQCEQGEGEFAGKSPEERRRIHNRFTDLLVPIDMHGIFTAIDLRAWAAITSRVRYLRSRRYASSFHVAMQTVLEDVALGVRAVGVADGERINFVFDRRKGEEQNVLNIFSSLKDSRNPKLAFVRDKLGALTFAESTELCQLQAADLFAYEVQAHFVEDWFGIQRRPWSRRRWQKLFQKLQTDPAAGHCHVKATLPGVLKAMEDQWQAEADLGAQEAAKARAERAARGAVRRAANAGRKRGGPKG